MSPGQEIAYPFPRGRAVIAVVPDHNNTFCFRFLWWRGKTRVPFFETTPLRSMAQIGYRGQTFSVSLTQHQRQRRKEVALLAERQATTTNTCLQCNLVITGSEDRLSWNWRIAARVGERQRLTQDEGDVTLCLPLAPGKMEALFVPSRWQGLALWRDNIVVTLALPVEPDRADPPQARLALHEQAVHLHLPRLPLNNLDWAGLETWVSPAATREEAEHALLRHLADVADRAQQPWAGPLELLCHADQAARALMAPQAADKRGVDKLVLRADPRTPQIHVNGDGADAALVAHALWSRHRFGGDDAERRRALLLARGACAFQIVDEESTHRGALWDRVRAKEHWEDADGNRTVSVATTARAAFGLRWMHACFGLEILGRTALTAAQWLLLKMDANGFYAGERYHEDGPPVEGGSAWVLAEALRPLVETFRRTKNDVFIKAALRVVKGLQTGLGAPPLTWEQATPEFLAEAIEGVLYVSRESENEAMIALAQKLGLFLRTQRTAEGALCHDETPVLGATLAAARGALALARVDADAIWPLVALRALRASIHLAPQDALLRPADQAGLCLLPFHLLLTLAARAPQCVVDRDALTLTRAWQIFGPDPTTREWVKVTADNAPVDYITLVSPMNLQVLIVALADASVGHIQVLKNNRTPYLKNLLTNDYAQEAKLVPLGDGKEANFGVFLADT